MLSDNPFDRGVVYTASALGTALLAYATISWVADQFATSPAIDLLRRAGQLSLTIYVGHALVFNLRGRLARPDRTRRRRYRPRRRDRSTGRPRSLVAGEYQRHFGRGPVEQLYRRFTD